MKLFRHLFILTHLLAVMPASVFAQADGTGFSTSFRINEIRIEFTEDTLNQSAQELIRSSILNKLRLFPHDYVRMDDLDRAMLRLQSIPEVGTTTYDLKVSTGMSYILVIKVSTAAERLLQEEARGIFAKNRRGSFPYLYENGNVLLKLGLGATASVVAGDNVWLNNGQFFTEYSPFGNDPPEDNFAGFEYAINAGLSLAFKIAKNTYVYGSYRALFMQTLGRDVYRSDNPYSIQTENLYGGVVGTFTTSNGNVLNYNISAGRQPYRIGTGMLLCQIAYNGGEKGAMDIWPNFSGDFVGLAQVRYDNLKAEIFFVEPNEFGALESRTQLTGINLEYGKPYGIAAGFTYLNVPRSTTLVLFPDGEQETRKGMNAFNLRGEWIARPGSNSIIAKAEGGLQTNSRFPVLAWGMAAELGYSFSASKLKPSFSYRFSHLTGDDPETERYERWDLLYSGNDVDTWIQGLIMKNILYNTNLQAHRAQVQMLARGWRITGQYFYFRSDELNNLPLAINTFASRELAHQITLMVDRSFLKRFYTRILFHALWAKDGITGALPNESSNPWTGFQVLVKYQL
ncbi:MAG: hypothetical protein JXB00_05620 [Bacteroidales bacterium]|nr:hypothetical protein [Bacteroidales bacterium]